MIQPGWGMEPKGPSGEDKGVILIPFIRPEEGFKGLFEGRFIRDLLEYLLSHVGDHGETWYSLLLTTKATYRVAQRKLAMERLRLMNGLKKKTVRFYSIIRKWPPTGLRDPPTLDQVHRAIDIFNRHMKQAMKELPLWSTALSIQSFRSHLMHMMIRLPFMDMPSSMVIPYQCMLEDLDELSNIRVLGRFYLTKVEYEHLVCHFTSCILNRMHLLLKRHPKPSRKAKSSSI